MPKPVNKYTPRTITKEGDQEEIKYHPERADWGERLSKAARIRDDGTGVTFEGPRPSWADAYISQAINGRPPALPPPIAPAPPTQRSEPMVMLRKAGRSIPVPASMARELAAASGAEIDSMGQDIEAELSKPSALRRK